METIQIGDNTTPTAVERTPPEVWRMALLLAVESPLRPQSGDDVLDGNIVFSICCRSSKRFERTEALRTQLRLVCQEWNAILKDVGHHVVFFDHGYLKHPRFRGEASLKIRRLAGVRGCHDHNYPVYVRDYASIFPLEDTQWVESFIIGDAGQADIKYQFIMKVLDNAPRLRALQILDSMPRQYFRKILDHQAITRITHLSIEFGGVAHEGRLCFPAVQYLRLHLLNQHANESIPDWQFLSLRSFHLYLYRNEWRLEGGRDLFEGLDHFIAVHGQKITSLFIEWVDLGYSYDPRLYHSEEDFWRWFPNLRLLRPEMRALRSLTPPPADSKLTSLAIPGLQTWGHNGMSFPLDIYIDVLLEACKVLRVTRLIMTDSWEDMIPDPTYRPGSTLCWPRQLFEEAAANDIQVFDSDRIPITDRKGELFLQRLRDPPSPGPVGAALQRLRDPTPSGSVGAALPRFRKSLMRRFVDKFSILTMKKGGE